MSCYYPIKAVEIGLNDNGKKKLSFNFDGLDDDKDAIIWKHKGYKIIELPCGKCIGCRLDYSRDWANRCMYEAKQYKHNYFLTITYDDEHLKRQMKIDKETGEVIEIKSAATLFKKDLQNFMKNLRRHWEYKYKWNGIRFYACGEYGDKRGRPHYHIILFNCPIYDLKSIRKSDKGQLLWNSAEIEKIWGQGLTAIGEVTWDSAAYTARYVMKKIKGPEKDKIYDDIGIIPEFTLMSRKPGIGKNYFDEHADEIYKYDEMLVQTRQKVIRAKPARYYDKLFDLSNPTRMAEIKEERLRCTKNAEALRATDIGKSAYREVQARTKQNAIKSLRRKYERGIQ